MKKQAFLHLNVFPKRDKTRKCYIWDRNREQQGSKICCHKELHFYLCQTHEYSNSSLERESINTVSWSSAPLSSMPGVPFLTGYHHLTVPQAIPFPHAPREMHHLHPNWLLCCFSYSRISASTYLAAKKCGLGGNPQELLAVLVSGGGILDVFYFISYPIFPRSFYIIYKHDVWLYPYCLKTKIRKIKKSPFAQGYFPPHL